MSSHLIIGPLHSAQKTAQDLAPFPIIPDIDCLIVETEDDSLKIAQVRDLKQFLTKKPYHHDNQIVFIPEAHRLTIPAQNALLKTLEEPPAHALIFLTTSYPDRLLPTVISRCQLHHSQRESIAIDPTKFAQHFTDIKAKNLGQKISHAIEFAYPKSKAVVFCQQALQYFHHQLRTDAQNKHAHNARLAQQTLDRIEANVDPKLSLEYFVLNLLV